MKKIRHSLVTRLTAGIVAVELAILSLLVWNSVRLINSSHAELFTQVVQEEVGLVGALLINGLMVRDIAVLTDDLNRIKGKRNVVYAVVYGRRGEKLAAIGEVPAAFLADTGYSSAKSDGVFDIEHPIRIARQDLGLLRAGFSIGSIENLTQKTRVQNIAIAAAGLLLSILATLTLGIYGIRRISSLEEGVVALRRGVRGFRIPDQRLDELGGLARAFNDMAIELQAQRAEIENKNEQLTLQVERTATLLDSVNAVIYECDASTGRVIFLAGDTKTVLGYPLEKVKEENFWEAAVCDEDREYLVKTWTQVRTTPGEYSLEYRINTESQNVRWIRNTGAAILDNDRKILRGLCIDMHQQKQMEVLEKERKLAIEASKTKSAFLAKFSHELRTPLNAILGYNGLVSEDIGNSELSALRRDAWRRDLAHVDTAGKHLLGLISDILDFAKIESGKIELSCRETDLGACIESAVNLIRPLAAQRWTSIKTTIEPNLPRLWTDPQRLYQIIANLASNAAKFTTSGTIWFRAYKRGKVAVIDVEDTGVGIRAEDLSKLFEEFSQVGKTSSKFEGTGLGLAICKRLAQAMGGEVTVVSAVGQGSCFTVTLPLRSEANSSLPAPELK